MKIKILILGASGMLGSTLFRYFSLNSSFDTYGSVRTLESVRDLLKNGSKNLIGNVDVLNSDDLIHLFENIRPNIVINCVGLVKQLSSAEDPLMVLPLNSVLPHKLAKICALANARLVHFSTDCVFSGSQGLYKESDFADAQDLYGRSKFLGEVDYPHAVTLRTSIIGHELNSSKSLVCWFLSQLNSVNGFKKAIFSGLPTIEIAKIIEQYVLPYPQIKGLYHLSAEPISKFDLLSLVAQQYAKNIEIIPNDVFQIDRSLDSNKFQMATGFRSKPWKQMIKEMYDFK